jgi:cell division protein FtsQ
VLIRREPGNLRAQEYRQGKQRKRLDVSLGTPGAEMRLPSIPTIHFGWRLFSALIAIALAGLMYYLWSAPTFRVQAAEVSGAQRVSAGDINMVLGISDEPIFLLNPEHLRQNVQKAFPEMAAITVEVKLPSTVQVTVQERQPVLLWQPPNRSPLWVDAEGVAFPPRGEVGPLVTVEGQFMTTTVTTMGAETLPRLNPKLVAAVLALSKQAPEGVTLVYDPEHGMGWQDPRGWQAYFGLDIENMDVKLKEYQALVDKLMNDGVTPALISVEFTHAPYYRLER